MGSSELLCLPRTRLSISSTFNEKEFRNRHLRLHVDSAPRQRIRCSMDTLSTELLALIFLQVRELDPQSLATARLASRRLYAVITPIKYEVLRLNEQIVAPEAECLQPHGLHNVFSFTKHVEVLGEFKLENVRRVMNNIRHLKSVRWRYCAPHLRSGDYWVPSDVLKPANLPANGVRLTIEDFPLEFPTRPAFDAYQQAIPSAFLVSIQAESRHPLRPHQLDSLKRLLMASPRLETLKYNDNGQGTRFQFNAGDRLPPIRKLVLQSYNWDHTREQAAAHWDFSQLNKLVLTDVPMYPFLSSIQLPALQHLRKLECEDFSPASPEVRRKSTALFAQLVNHIHELEELKITCNTELFPLQTLLSQGQTLSSLRFRHWTGFGEDDTLCPTMEIADLAQLTQRLPKLESLEIDLDVKNCTDSKLFLATLCEFRQLKNLTLYIRTLVDPFEEDVDMEGDGDLDRGKAWEMFNVLLEERKKQRRQSALSTDIRWSNITINVGEWRPGQLRRLSEAWREKNLQGIYAERCFVWEKVSCATSPNNYQFHELTQKEQ